MNGMQCTAAVDLFSFGGERIGEGRAAQAAKGQLSALPAVQYTLVSALCTVVAFAWSACSPVLGMVSLLSCS